MYCEDSMATDIDHYRPKSRFPDYCYDWENYLLACSHCNSNLKRNQFPLKRGRPMLINPTLKNPMKHLALSLSTGIYFEIDEIGRQTIKVFGLNREICVQGRQMAWVSLCALFSQYDKEINMNEVAETIQNFPFQGVRRTLVQIFSDGDPAAVIPAEIIGILGRRPELLAL
ncbi:HNH endonuclease [Rhodococcoides kroppenstedtii]|uniref:HNH endonuclease n=1 Tax=Rhodococcoides kroppenstedtii TaxID=293050 RepID=UPI003636E156